MITPVLIVDADPALRELIAYGLGRAGWPVELAASGGEALARICGSRPGAVVLDLSLPDIHGVGVLEIVRGLWSVDPIPVVVMARNRTQAFRKEILHLGADALVGKPFQLEDLVATVESLLKKRSGRAQSRSGNLGQKSGRGMPGLLRRRQGSTAASLRPTLSR